MELQERWKLLLSFFTENEELVRSYWQEIEEAYSGKGRHYHNLGHLQYMFEKAVPFQDQITDWQVLSFSIFYHDFIYKATKKDNEKQSALWAEKRLNVLGLSQDRIEKCKRQIIATKLHEKQNECGANFLIDIDLAILGDSPEAYAAYTQKVRKEYSIYPDFLYKRGRKKVLLHFLEKESIFLTETFQHLENQARKNLTKELEALKG